jgi:hypothetical protein
LRRLIDLFGFSALLVLKISNDFRSNSTETEK